MNHTTDSHMLPKSDKKCIWNLNCEGCVYDVPWFDLGIAQPICENHLVEHRIISTLHKAGFDINEILQSSPEKRKEMVDGIPLISWNECTKKE